MVMTEYEVRCSLLTGLLKSTKSIQNARNEKKNQTFKYVLTYFNISNF